MQVFSLSLSQYSRLHLVAHLTASVDFELISPLLRHGLLFAHVRASWRLAALGRARASSQSRRDLSKRLNRASLWITCHSDHFTFGSLVTRAVT